MAENKSQINSWILKLLVWRIKHISDNNFILISAGLIGVCSGLAAVTLKSAVHALITYLEIGLDLFDFHYLYLVYPLIGIFLTVLVSKYLFKENLGHGITQILYAISKNSSNTKLYILLWSHS